MRVGAGQAGEDERHQEVKKKSSTSSEKPRRLLNEEYQCHNVVSSCAARSYRVPVRGGRAASSLRAEAPRSTDSGTRSRSARGRELDETQ